MERWVLDYEGEFRLGQIDQKQIEKKEQYDKKNMRVMSSH